MWDRGASWTCIEGEHTECTSARCDCGCHPYEDVPANPGDKPYRTYREYLKHPRFRAIRAKVFQRADGVCERCETRPPTEPHHLWYPRWGMFDVPGNMIAVCHPCHCEIHEKAE
jgi:hypothetical protein